MASNWKSAVAEVVRARGARGVSVREIAEQLHVPRRSAYRAIEELQAEGEIDRPAHGVIRARAAAEPVLPTLEAERVWRMLHDQQRTAYLTGLDVVGRFAHHFLVDFPHVVVAAPGTGDDIAFDATAGGFVVARHAADVEVSNQTNVVIIHERHRIFRYPIADHVAPVELAWVDLYRDAYKGIVAVDPWEVGVILRNILDAGFLEKRLRTFARDASPEVMAVLDGRAATGFGRAAVKGARGR